MRIPFNLVNIEDVFGSAIVEGDVYPGVSEYRRYLSQTHGLSATVDASNNLHFEYSNDDLQKGKVFTILDAVLPDFDYSKLLYMGTRYACTTINGPSLREVQAEVKRFGIPRENFRVFQKYDCWFVHIDWDPFWVNRKLAIDAGKIDSRTWIAS